VGAADSQQRVTEFFSAIRPRRQPVASMNAACSRNLTQAEPAEAKDPSAHASTDRTHQLSASNSAPVESRNRPSQSPLSEFAGRSEPLPSRLRQLFNSSLLEKRLISALNDSEMPPDLLHQTCIIVSPSKRRADGEIVVQ
jgi:hypothetical protein